MSVLVAAQRSRPAGGEGGDGDDVADLSVRRELERDHRPGAAPVAIHMSFHWLNADERH
jgi:hypothetical protein